MSKQIGPNVTCYLLAVLLLLSVAPATTAQVVCVPTDFFRDNMFLTARLVDPPMPVNFEVDATGCNIGVYYHGGSGTISNAGIHGANYFGVVVHGASVYISNSSIYDIGETPFNGAQHGVAIFYLKDVTASAPATGAVERNHIWNYQKNGVTVRGNGTTVTLQDNVVTGLGPVDFIAQNGVQFDADAAGIISGNVISDNFYENRDPDCTGPGSFPVGSCIAVATGVLLFQASSTSFPNAGVIQRANDVRHNQVQVFLIK